MWKDGRELVVECRNLFFETPAAMQYKTKMEGSIMIKTRDDSGKEYQIRTESNLDIHPERYLL
jgi:hypothetical protein